MDTDVQSPKDQGSREAGDAAPVAGSAGGATAKAGRRSSRARRLSGAIESAVAAAAAHRPREAHSLPAVFTIHEAEQVRSDLIELMELPGAVVLEAGAVERVDTAALQLIASLIKSCRRDGRAVSWHRWSEEVARAAQILGLEDLLALEVNGE